VKTPQTTTPLLNAAGGAHATERRVIAGQPRHASRRTTRPADRVGRKPVSSFGLAVLAAPIFALAASACGSSSSPRASQPTTGTESPATAQFVAAVDRTCAAQDQKEKVLGPGLINADIVPADHLPKAAAYLDKIVAIKVEGLAELQRLATTGSPPDADARNALVVAIQTVIGDYQAAAAAAHSGDLAHFRTDMDRVAQGGMPTGPDAQALARASSPFRFKACGTGQGL
jgi:hypothetical protein